MSYLNATRDNKYINVQSNHRIRKTSSERVKETKRRMKKVASKANSLSFFFRTMGKDPHNRIFSIFGNRLKRHNDEPLPPIMGAEFTMIDPAAKGNEDGSGFTSRKVKFNARKTIKRAVSKTRNIGRLKSPKKKKKNDDVKTRARHTFNAAAVAKVKRAVNNINRLANLVHFFHFESDEHDHGIDGPKSKVESLSHLLESLRSFYDPDGEHEGNPHYSDLALLKREAIKWNPRVRRMLDQLWEVTDNDHDACIEKNEYIDMCMKVYRAVVDDNPDPALNQTRRQYAEVDWEGDHMGYGNLNKNRFTRAWFQLADHWTHDVSSTSYAEFLEAVYQAVAIKSTKTGKVYWKLDENIKRFNLKNIGMGLEESDTIHLIYGDTPKTNDVGKEHLYLSKKQKLKYASKVLLHKKIDKIESRYNKRMMKDKVVEDSWMNKGVKAVYHNLDKLDLLDEEVHLSPTAARKGKNGLYIGSTISAPQGWENLALAPWSTAFHRINLDKHSNAAIDELARSKILAAVRAGIVGASKRRRQFLLSDLTPDQRQVQRLILLDLRQKYILLSKNNNVQVDPDFFNRMDTMLNKSYSMDNIDPKERVVYQVSEGEGSKTLQRPSSAPNLQLRDQKSITEYLNNNRKGGKQRPSTAGTRRGRKGKRKKRLKSAKSNEGLLTSPVKGMNRSNSTESVPNTNMDKKDHGGLVVFFRPPSIFGPDIKIQQNDNQKQTTKKKKKKRKKIRTIIRKKMNPIEKEHRRKRTITIKGLSFTTTTGSIRSTFKCWNQNVKKIIRDSVDTVRIVFASHRDFKNSMNMLKILAQSENAKITNSPSSSKFLNSLSHQQMSGYNSIDGYYSSGGEEDQQIYDLDDYMYGLSRVRPESPPISPIKIPKKLWKLLH